MHKNQWCINYVTDESLRPISDPKSEISSTKDDQGPCPCHLFENDWSSL